MLKHILLGCILLFIAACSASTPSAVTPAVAKMDNEEMVVYGFLLSKMYKHTGYVIMDSTSTNETGGQDTSQTLDYVLSNLHDVDPSTVMSFKDRNSTAHRLPANMAFGSSYTLLTQADRNEIFSLNQSGWDIFYSRYPDAPGITTFSKVGFNSSLDQALVYIGTSSNWHVGEGYYILLQQTNGSWSINQKVLVWES
jgi:hypothetical protein